MEKIYKLGALIGMSNVDELIIDRLNEVIAVLNGMSVEQEITMDQDYYYIGNNGVVEPATWRDTSWDIQRLKFRNVFLTATEAISARDKIKALLADLK